MANKIAGDDYWTRFRNALKKYQSPGGKDSPSFTAREMAKKAGVSDSTMCRALRGKKVKADIYFQIVKKLGLVMEGGKGR